MRGRLKTTTLHVAACAGGLSVVWVLCFAFQLNFLARLFSPWTISTPAIVLALALASVMLDTRAPVLVQRLGTAISLLIATLAGISLLAIQYPHPLLLPGPPHYLFGVLFLGFALSFQDIETKNGIRPADACILIAASDLLMALGGYLIGFYPYFSRPQQDLMGFGTIVVLLLICWAAMLQRADRGFVGISTGTGPGALLAKTLLPIPFAFPFLLGAVNRALVVADVYSQSTGAWAFGLANTAGFAILICWVAYLIHSTDQERIRNAEALWATNALLERRVRERTNDLEQANQQLEQQIAEKQKAVRQLAQTNEELEQFAYLAAHDLQEPLRNVSMYAQMLARHYDGKLDESGTIFLEFINTGTKRMDILLRDMLAYSKVTHEEPEAVPVDCNWALREAKNSLSDTIEQTGACIEFGILPTLHCGPTQIIQVFQNLISNALKYKSEAPPVVRIHCERSGENWLFSVRDNGIGIDPQYSEKIFGLFKRLHKYEYPGTGLGLALCRRIIQSYGGRIWVESKLGEGSAFFFTLPARQRARSQTA